MSIIYSLDLSKAIAFAVWEGVITAEDLRQSLAGFLAEPEVHSIRGMIGDAQQVTDDSSVTNADVEETTTIFGGATQLPSKPKLAVVTNHTFATLTSAESALVRMGISVVTFNFLETACVYLGIPLEETQRTLDELRAKLLSRGNQ